MKLINFFTLLFAGCILLTACKKEVSYQGGPDNGSSLIPEPITTVLQGNILDEQGLPAAGVDIAAGGKTTTTDAKGYFRINPVALDKKNAVVTATKSGYFKGIRHFAATSGTNQVTIKLIKKELAGTIAASSGGVVTLANGTKIELPSNGVVIASGGAAYSGNINVYSAYINPEGASSIPGSLAGIDKSNNKVSLQSFGMIAVELENTNGQKLQLAADKPAKLTMPIADPAKAPASIPLWYLDEEKGLWKEEGAATKTGSNYVGEVKHFSFWNCDARFEGVYIHFKLQNADKKPLVFTQVNILAVVPGFDGYLSASGFTDSLGMISGFVPANTNLIIQMLDPCGSAFFKQTINPLSKDTDLGVITVTGSGSASTASIRGILHDCNNNVVSLGYAIITMDNIVRYAGTNKDGIFEVGFIKCAGTPLNATIIGIDKNSQQQSQPISVPVSAASDAGIITACGTSSAQYVNYNIDGKSTNLNSANSDSLLMIKDGSKLYLNASALQGNQKFISFSFSGSAAGTYPILSLSIQGSQSPSIIAPFTVTLTKYPQTIGEFYEGSFSGKYKDGPSSTTDHTLSGTFRIRKNF